MFIWKRLKNLWILSGYEQSEGSKKAESMTKKLFEMIYSDKKAKIIEPTLLDEMEKYV